MVNDSDSTIWSSYNAISRSRVRAAQRISRVRFESFSICCSTPSNSLEGNVVLSRAAALRKTSWPAGPPIASDSCMLESTTFWICACPRRWAMALSMADCRFPRFEPIEMSAAGITKCCTMRWQIASGRQMGNASGVENNDDLCEQNDRSAHKKWRETQSEFLSHRRWLFRAIPARQCQHKNEGGTSEPPVPVTSYRIGSTVDPFSRRPPSVYCLRRRRHDQRQ